MDEEELIAAASEALSDWMEAEEDGREDDQMEAAERLNDYIHQL
ncbi:hypothetical protein IMSAG049_00859 [Clostridiales bacterium]|nr:hypothetical protein IMSAG049_00859 [Clostridiales bacterium]